MSDTKTFLFKAAGPMALLFGCVGMNPDLLGQAGTTPRRSVTELVDAQQPFAQAIATVDAQLPTSRPVVAHAQLPQGEDALLEQVFKAFAAIEATTRDYATQGTIVESKKGPQRLFWDIAASEITDRNVAAVDKFRNSIPADSPVRAVLDKNHKNFAGQDNPTHRTPSGDVETSYYQHGSVVAREMGYYSEMIALASGKILPALKTQPGADKIVQGMSELAAQLAENNAAYKQGIENLKKLGFEKNYDPLAIKTPGSYVY